MEEQKPELVLALARRQRWSGMWNGIVIGMGIGWVILGNALGFLPIGMGIALEIIQRRVMAGDR